MRQDIENSSPSGDGVDGKNQVTLKPELLTPLGCLVSDQTAGLVTGGDGIVSKIINERRLLNTGGCRDCVSINKK
jgi:hypothetical protein